MKSSQSNCKLVWGEGQFSINPTYYQGRKYIQGSNNRPQQTLLRSQLGHVKAPHCASYLQSSLLQSIFNTVPDDNQMKLKWLTQQIKLFINYFLSPFSFHFYPLSTMNWVKFPKHLLNILHLANCSAFIKVHINHFPLDAIHDLTILNQFHLFCVFIAICIYPLSQKHPTVFNCLFSFSYSRMQDPQRTGSQLSILRTPHNIT